MSDQEQEIVVTLAAEITARLQPMEVILRPMTAFQMVGLIQLALRHDEVPPEIRETGERFVWGVREYFADCPMVLDVIRGGDDPAEDILR